MMNAAAGIFLAARRKKGWTNPYVTDGLVAQYDGEWNAGGGVHDAAATAWKDLSGNDYDLTAPQSYQWGKKYCDITAGNQFSGDAEVITQHATTEFVGCFTQAYTRTTSTDMGVVFGGRGLGTFFLQDISSSNDLLLICRSTITGSAFYVRRGPQPQDAVTRYVNTPTAFSGYGYRSTTNPVTVDNLKIYVDGIERNGSISTYWTSPYSSPTKTVYVGSTGKTNIRLFTVRLYSRDLTAEEVARNYAVDKARFNLP